MAKGQQKSNREAKKPKKAAPSKPAAGTNYGQIKAKPATKR